MFASDEVDNNLLLGKNSAFLLCNEGHMDRTLSCLTYMYLRSLTVLHTALERYLRIC